MRCPNCGAPVDLPHFAATTQCRYCHHSILLAQPPPPVQFAHAPPPPVRGASRRTPLFIFAAVATVVASVTAYLSMQLAQSPAAVAPPAAAGPAVVPAPGPKPQAPKPVVPVAVSYPLASLLGINAAVDIDASRAHLTALFPTITSEQRAGELSYRLPLKHPWFSALELNWENEKNGRLASVAFRPPAGDDKFKNQKEISDCLTKGLGKPEVRELDHLAGELSYFWGKHFPNAWADVYSSYLWLAFEDSKGAPPVTFANVVRTLAACAP
jgi:DNA-directed RNA polymerase subunit RPC12/RpoP